MNWLDSCKDILRNSDGQTLPPKFKLPVLPTAITEFAKRSNDPEVTSGQLARILEADSGLTADILQLVNSSANGLRSTVSSVKQAISLLGFKKVQLFVLTVGAKRAMSRCDSKLINLTHFWSTNLERALLAREVAGLLRVDKEMAFAGAMLQDFLLPVLSHAPMKDYVNYWENPDRRSADLVDYEQSRFGVNHAQVAGICLLKWNVPDELVCAALCHHMNYHQLETMGLLGTHIHAVAASSLIPVRIPQHRTPAIPLSEWDQTDSSLKVASP